MGGPWEKYAAEKESGPWEKYSQPKADIETLKANINSPRGGKDYSAFNKTSASDAAIGFLKNLGGMAAGAVNTIGRATDPSEIPGLATDLAKQAISAKQTADATPQDAESSAYDKLRLLAPFLPSESQARGAAGFVGINADKLANAAKNRDVAGMVQEAGPALAVAAGAGPATRLAGGTIDAIPSKARAVENFQKSGGVANEIPVDYRAALDKAYEIKKAAAGTAVPQIVSDFIKRVDPIARSNRGLNQAPRPIGLPFEEARYWQSNASQLSALDKMGMNKNMTRLVGEFAHELGKGTQATADLAGPETGTAHAAAMKEFAQAAKIEAVKDTIKSYAKKTAIGASGVGSLGWLLNELASRRSGK